MKARAVILDAGGWMPFPVGTWADVVSMLSTPWPATVIHADLVWWEDRASPSRPPLSALAARWGVSKSAAHRFVSAFDGVDAVGTTVGRSRDAAGTTGKGSKPPIAPVWDAAGTMLGRQWDDAGTVPLENVENPMVFEGLQKQKTEAEDREATSLEASSSNETVVALDAPPAAPPALGPTDPDTEPDWDDLFRTVPLTYDDEATDGEAADRGRVDKASGDDRVEAVGAQQEPPEVAPPVAVDVADVDPARGVRAGGLREASAPGGVLTPEESATQPPPATRKRKAPRPAPVGDVETLWEAWRVHGTVRGEPNPKRRGLLARAIEAHGLAAMVDVLDAAHTGDGGYWRHLQGATERNDTPYLSPETLLNGRLVERVERAAQWVKAGRPRHQVEETRAEARAQAAENTLKQRAINAWEKVILPNRGMRQKQFDEMLAKWGDGPKAQEGRRAIAGGLTQVKGLPVIGAANDFTRPRLYRDFVRGFVEALGGTVSEAELLAVG